MNYFLSLFGSFLAQQKHKNLTIPYNDTHDNLEEMQNKYHICVVFAFVTLKKCVQSP